MKLKAALKPLALTFAAAVAAPAAIPVVQAQTMYDLSPVVEQVMPSNVSIYITGAVEMPVLDENSVPDEQPSQPDPNAPPPNEKPKAPATSLGSGFVIDGDNQYIVTNNHVVEGASAIDVMFKGPNERHTYSARVVGTDPASDLAVIQLSPKREPLKAVKFGDSALVKEGQLSFAIGNPLGRPFTVTAGIISALDRDLGNTFNDYIQTDAAINRGNSGGALYNIRGEFIGTNTAILSPNGGSIGLGFSIPANDVKFVAEQIIKDGRVRWGYLGVGLTTVLDGNIPSGVFDMRDSGDVVVNTVTPGTPADRARLKPLDIIKSVDGTPIGNIEEFVRTVGHLLAGASPEVVYKRNGVEEKTIVTLTERPRPGQPAAAPRAPAP